MFETKSINDKDLKLKLPFGMIISGPSNSGKTTLLLKILRDRNYLIDPKPARVLYCYGEYNSQIPLLQRSGILVHKGPPTDEMIQSIQKPALIILDDLLYTIDEAFLSNLFVKKIHHNNLAVIMLVQNLFDKRIKVARINSQYIVLMTAPNAALQVRNLGVQIFPKELQFFLRAYKNAVESQKYGYLFLDLHPASDPLLRVRTNIFKDDEEKVLYINNKGNNVA
jgi:hypothetical protein